MKLVVLGLALGLAGCAVCHAPPPTPVPPGVDAAAFIDQASDCWTIDLRPGAVEAMRIIADVLHLFVGATTGGEG